MNEIIYRNHQDVPGLIVAHNTITEENEKDLVLWAKMFHGGRYFQSSSDGHFSCERDQFHPIVQQVLAGVGARMMPDLCPLTRLHARMYRQGESLHNHFDGDEKGEVVFGISLAAHCVMVFEPDRSRGAQGARQRIPLPRRSCYLMSGPAMFNWTHGIQGVGKGMVIPPPTW